MFFHIFENSNPRFFLVRVCTFFYLYEKGNCEEALVQTATSSLTKVFRGFLHVFPYCRQCVDTGNIPASLCICMERYDVASLRFLSNATPLSFTRWLHSLSSLAAYPEDHWLEHFITRSCFVLFPLYDLHWSSFRLYLLLDWLPYKWHM